MANAKIVYATMTGNTEEIAQAFQESLKKAGAEVELTDVNDAKAEDFKNFDILVVATYTYGQGELPDDIQDFYEDLKDIDLAGKVYAVLGSGDTSYDYMYCKAADDFDAILTEAGAKKAAPVYKIEFNEYDQGKLDEIAQALVNAA
ncbi:MAG: flavodoxin [Bifidobacteriaceae bacterium]|jgi:flavodoxin short chain|nr:flavodoxin [Bifidobacteriaceae bacterium]